MRPCLAFHGGEARGTILGRFSAVGTCSWRVRPGGDWSPVPGRWGCRTGAPVSVPPGVHLDVVVSVWPFGAQCPQLVPGLAEEQKRRALSVPFSLVPSPVVVPALSSPRTDSILENVVSPGTGFVFSAGDSVPCSENRGPRAGPDGGWGWAAPARVTGSRSLADRPVARWGAPAAYIPVSPARLSAARNGASAPLQ